MRFLEKLFRISFGGMLLMAAFVIGLAMAQDENRNEWEHPELVGQNRLAPHATMMIYPDIESAKQAEAIATLEDRSRSPWFSSLNGNWKFMWSANPDERPTDFYKTDFDDSGWDTIPVPSNMETQDYGVAIYTNVQYPWGPTERRGRRNWQTGGSWRRI